MKKDKNITFHKKTEKRENELTEIPRAQSTISILGRQFYPTIIARQFKSLQRYHMLKDITTLPFLKAEKMCADILHST